MKNFASAIVTATLLSTTVFAQQFVGKSLNEVKKDYPLNVESKWEDPAFYSASFYENIWQECGSMIRRLRNAQIQASYIRGSSEQKYQFLADKIDAEYKKIIPKLPSHAVLPHTMVLLKEVNKAAKNIKELAKTAKPNYINSEYTVAIDYLKEETQGTLGTQAYVFVNELVDLIVKVQRDIDSKHFMPFVKSYCNQNHCGRHDSYSYYNNSFSYDFKEFDKSYTQIAVDFIKTYEKLAPYAGSYTNQLKMSKQAALSSLTVLNSSMRRHIFRCPMNELSYVAQFAQEHITGGVYSYVDVQTAANWVTGWLKEVRYDVVNQNCH